MIGSDFALAERSRLKNLKKKVQNSDNFLKKELQSLFSVVSQTGPHLTCLPVLTPTYSLLTYQTVPI